MAFTRSLINSRNFSSGTDGLIFRQLFDAVSSTYTYLLGDVDSRKCIIIDPVLEQAKRDYQIAKDLNLNLVYVGMYDVANEYSNSRPNVEFWDTSMRTNVGYYFVELTPTIRKV